MLRQHIIGAIGVATILISGLVLLALPSLINNKITNELVLLPENEIFEQWTKMDLPIYMRFRLFDVQNPDEVEFNGSRPIVVERGPYTFLQKRWKEVVDFDDMGKFVEFREFKRYHFLRELSVGDLSDEVTAVNIPLIAAIDGSLREAETSDLGLVVVDVVNAVIKELEEPLFEVHTLDEMLFSGYQVPLLERMGEIAKGFGLDVPEGLPNNTFGLMVNKNNTDLGLMKVHTGLLGNPFKVHSWDNMTHVPYWKSSACNQINGTDGSGFGPSFVTRQSHLYLFQSDFCRSAHVVYKEDSSVFGIPTYRFVFPDSMYQSAATFEDNECFCTQRKGHRDLCDLDGLLDMSACSDGVPIAMSPPHFLGANSKLRQDVIGLRPDPVKHDTYLDIEPLTGAVLNAVKRMQINIRIEPSPEVPTTASVRNVILPILWIEELVSIDATTARQMKSSFRMISASKFILRLVLLVGLMTVVVAMSLHLVDKRQLAKINPRLEVNVHIGTTPY